MFIFFILFGLIFLISGGIGLFHVNMNLGAGTNLWLYGNIIFGTFAVVGIAIFVFLALFNSEFE